MLSRPTVKKWTNEWCYCQKVVWSRPRVHWDVLESLCGRFDGGHVLDKTVFLKVFALKDLFKRSCFFKLKTKSLRGRNNKTQQNVLHNQAKTCPCCRVTLMLEEQRFVFTCYLLLLWTTVCTKSGAHCLSHCFLESLLLKEFRVLDIWLFYLISINRRQWAIQWRLRRYFC